MKTSNFANNKIHNLLGISISRHPDKRSGFSGPEFPPLFPPEWLLKGYKLGQYDWSNYRDVYCSQLKCLNADATYSELMNIAKRIGASEPILLCYESAKTLDSKPCHRRLVAQWFFNELSIDVPEWIKPM